MTSSTAVCGGCGARYRVPEAGGTYRCKRCGGEVRGEAAPEPATASAPDASPEPQHACEACGAVLPGAASFCPECGHAPGANPARPLRRAERDEKRLAASDLRRAARSIRVLRIAFGLFAVLSLIIVAASLEDLRGRSASSEDWIAVGVVALVSALSAGSVFLASVHPFPCTVTIASLWSVYLVARIATHDVPSLFSVVFALFLWTSLVPTLRARRLLREHPELYEARRLLGVHGRGARDGAALQAAATRRAWRNAGLVAGGILALTSLVGGGIALGRGKGIEPSLVAFESAWRQGDPAAVAALLPREQRAGIEARLRAAPTRRGWKEWPTLAPRQPRTEEDADLGAEVRQDFFLDGLLVKERIVTRWGRSGNEWALLRIDLPPPNPLAEITSFKSAWATSDVGALAELFPETKRDSIRSSLQRLADRRGWSTGFPELGGVSVNVLDSDSARASFETSAGKLELHWQLDEQDRWLLTALDPPD